MDAPYDERRDRLESLHLSGETFTTTDSFRDVSGQDILTATVENGLEGVVAKRRRVAVSTGPAALRLDQGQVLPDPGGGHRRLDGWAGRAAGQPGRTAPRDPRRAAGCATSARSGPASARSARAAPSPRLRALATPENPFISALPASEAATAHFVRPELVGEVGFGEWTTAGRLRHPTWRGPAPRQGARTKSSWMTRVGSVMASSKSTTRTTIGGRELSVSNLEKVLFPQSGFTKGQLIDYYVRVAR